VTGLGRALWSLGVAGVVFGLAIVPIVLTSDLVPVKGLTLGLALVSGWGFIGAGLDAWWRRPESNFGPLMTATGFGWFVAGTGVSDLPLVFVVGQLLGNVFIASLVHLLLSMPDGRLETRDRKLLAGGWPSSSSSCSTWWPAWWRPACSSRSCGAGDGGRSRSGARSGRCCSPAWP